MPLRHKRGKKQKMLLRRKDKKRIVRFFYADRLGEGKTSTARQLRSVVPKTRYESRKKDRTLASFSRISQQPWVIIV